MTWAITILSQHIDCFENEWWSTYQIFCKIIF